MAKEGLQMTKNVHFVIFGIFVVMETGTVSYVRVSKVELYCVLFI